MQNVIIVWVGSREEFRKDAELRHFLSRHCGIAETMIMIPSIAVTVTFTVTVTVTVSDKY